MPVDELTEEVLAYINTARILAGYEPLKDLRKGLLEQPRSCPIAASLKDISDVSVEYGVTEIIDDRFRNLAVRAFKTKLNNSRSYYVENPSCFNRFIDKFDEGEYPQYKSIKRRIKR